MMKTWTSTQSENLKGRLEGLLDTRVKTAVEECRYTDLVIPKVEVKIVNSEPHFNYAARQFWQ